MNDVPSKIRTLFNNRFVIFALFFLTFVIVQYLFFRKILPTTESKDLWFYSGIFMVLFTILFIEPYYSSPKNVITNVTPLLLVFLAIKPSFTNVILWWLAVIVLVMLLTASVIAVALDDNDNSSEHWRNKVSIYLKNIVVFIGQGKVLYSTVFLYFLLAYYSIQDFYTLTYFVIWFLILSIDPKKIHGSFWGSSKTSADNQIGEIFGVQSKKIFLVKIFEDKKNIKKFDLVKFKYSMSESKDSSISGIVFDTYLLNQEKWAKVLQLSETGIEADKLEKNLVYKIKSDDGILKALRVADLVGVVIEGSTIGKIRFEYSKMEDDLQEGDLLEVEIGGHRVFYQVVGGITEKEKLEARNETGFIEGEAIQLGEWDKKKIAFQKFGWIPAVSAPVFKSDAADIQVKPFSYPDYQLGKIPNTVLPSIINLDEAVSHHLALLGVTGSGKSFLACEIINQIKVNTKIICIDFNKEFVKTLNPPSANIISDQNAKVISEKIEWINNELEKFGNLQNKAGIQSAQVSIMNLLKSEIDTYLDDGTNNVKIFELPDVSNTTGIFDYTKYFFKALFELAKKRQVENNAVRICVVLEEAHTVIPEWNFSGSGDKASQGLVNSIGQIVLQGRKYGVGFLVIAQRTANVSKTVLTQCNTVICFQAFDETSFTFLGNYVGKEMVQALPNLKQYHAVVAGKALRANIPMIIDLTR